MLVMLLSENAYNSVIPSLYLLLICFCYVYQMGKLYLVQYVVIIITVYYNVTLILASSVKDTSTTITQEDSREKTSQFEKIITSQQQQHNISDTQTIPDEEPVSEIECN